MKNKNNKTKQTESEAYKAILEEGAFSCLTEEEPVRLIDSIINGKLNRIDSWKILSMIHNGELDCYLPQYGILTVHSLSKDIEQFNQLFSQGCDMLRDEKILTEDKEKEILIDLSKKLNTPKNKLFVKKNNNKKSKKQ